MMKQCVYLVLGFLVLLCGCQQQGDNYSGLKINKQPQALRVERRVEHPGEIVELHFNTGLVLLFKEIRSAQVVAVRAYVRMGSIYEGQNLGSGISHYFEHIIAGGSTAKRSEQENSKLLQSIGNNSNAYTTRDHTAYYITTEATYYNTAIELIGDYLANCLIAPREFSRERGVIIQEIRKNYDNPHRAIYKLLAEAMFPKHPAGQPVIGHEELFKQITRSQVVELYKRYYVANNTVLVVAGAVSEKEVIASVGKNFANYKRGTAITPVIPEPPRQLSTHWVEKYSLKISKTFLMLGYHTIPIYHPDLYALDLASEILGGGRSSRLYKALRSKGLVQSIYSYSHTPAYNAGVFAISAELEDAKMEQVLSVILAEIDKLQQSGATFAELVRARRKMLTSNIFGNETIVSQTSEAGTDYLSTGDPAFSRRYVEALQGVKVKDIQRVAQKYLTARNRTVALLRPAKEVGQNKSKDMLKTSTEKKAVKTDLIVLKNDLRLLYAYDPNLRSVLVQFTSLGGVMSENQQNNGVCRLMSTMLLQGTKKRSREVLHTQVDALGANIYSNSGNNSWYAGIKVLHPDFETGMELLSDVVLQPRFAAEDFVRERSRQRQIVRSLDDSWAEEARRFFRQKYFAGHVYALHPLGSEKSLALLDLKKMKQYYASTLDSTSSVLAIFGKVSKKEAMAMAKKYFLAVPLPVKPLLKVKTSVWQPQAGTYLKPNAKSQIVLTYGFPGVPIFSSDRYALTVLDAIISGYGYPSGWLHKSLRGDSDLVYFVHAYNWYGLGLGCFQILTQTSPSNLEQVMTRIDQVMQRVVETEPSPDELKSAAESIVISEAINKESLSARVSQASFDVLYGLGLDYHKNFPNLIRSVTATQVKAVAKKYFSKRVLTATGSKAALSQVLQYAKNNQLKISAGK